MNKLKEDIAWCRSVFCTGRLNEVDDKHLDRILIAAEKMEAVLKWYAEPDRDWGDKPGQAWSDRAQDVLREIG